MNTNFHAMAGLKNISTRQQIIETAVRVFSKFGFQRSSLDLIAIEAGVSKMTIFYHFRNKEELIIYALDHAHLQLTHDVRDKASKVSTDAKSYLAAVFGVLEEKAQAKELNSLYIRATAEYGDLDSEIRKTIVRHVNEVEMRFAALAVEARFENPQEVVDQLMTIMRGIYATQICPAASNRKVSVRQLVDCVIKVSPAFAA